MNIGIDNCTGNCSGWISSAKFGKGITFDGVNDIVTNSTPISIDFSSSNQLTEEFWVKGIVGNAMFFTYDWSQLARLYPSTNTMGSHIWFSDIGDQNTAGVSLGTVDWSQWHYVVFTYDGEFAHEYFDGVLKASTNFGGQLRDADSFKIGKIDNSAGWQYYFNGTLDEVKMWNRALSEEEINASYHTGLYKLYHNFTDLTEGTYTYTAYTQDLAGNTNNTETRTITIDQTNPTIDFVNPTRPNNTYTSDSYAYVNVTASDTNNISSFIDWNNSLVAWYRFDDNSDFTDHSTYSNTGTNYGSTYTEDGKLGSARTFDGSSDYINYGNDTSLVLTNELTIETWIKKDETIAGYKGVVSKWHNTNNASYLLQIGNSEQVSLLISHDGGLGDYDGVSSTSPILNDIWYHIVATYDNTTMKLYLNGVLNNSESETGDIFLGNRDLLIGKRADSNHFNGTIDNVRIYNKARSE